jgi:hypothetical protein
VAEALGLLVAEIDPPEPLLRLLDQLGAQAQSSAHRAAIMAIRGAVFSGDAMPATHAVRPTAVPAQAQPALWFAALEAAYRQGQVRDEDLVLDPAYRPLRQHRALSDVLCIAREF